MPRTDEDPANSAISALKKLAEVLCASADDGFAFTGRVEPKDRLGQTHVAIKQTYRGLDMVGPELTVHMTEDFVIVINGKFRPGIDLPSKAGLSSGEASAAALEHIRASGGNSGNVQEVRPL